MSGPYRKLTTSIFHNIFCVFSDKPYSDILFVLEKMNWSTNWDILELSRVVGKLGIRARYSGPLIVGLPRQSIFFVNRHPFLKCPWRYKFGGNRIAFPYYHGYPFSSEPMLVKELANLRRNHDKISKIQVTHSYMKDIILDSGIAPEKVFQIPIAVNCDFFRPQSLEAKKKFRSCYDIPQDAVLVGSFQKDGHGWGEGLQPKLIKGPDVFLDVIRIMKRTIPELFVLLSGPARGYVKNGLHELNVPYKHIYLEHYPEIYQLYQCLDLYIVASRQEGGPKAVLESMASGVPLVTTRVGQAMDLARHGENALMVNPEDSEGLAFWGQKLLSDTQLRNKLVKNGLITARENTYSAQVPLWGKFFEGFVELR